jgi:hypothetical protein
MLTARGRRWRGGLAALAAVLILGGTFYGDDDQFPFGPFRMFSTRTQPDGHVNVAVLRGRLDGAPDVADLSTASFGLRRAEVEGQLGRMQEDPRLLGELVRAREALRADLPRLSELRLVQIQYLLEDGRRIGYRETVMAEWRR